MENCLVKSLEASVNNDELLRLGEVKFSAVTQSGGGDALGVRFTESIPYGYRIVGNLTNSDGDKEVNISTPTNYYAINLAAGYGDIFLSDKNKIQILQFRATGLKDMGETGLINLPNLESLDLIINRHPLLDIKGTLDTCPQISRLVDKGIYESEGIDVSFFNQYPNLKYLDIDYRSIPGDISLLTNLHYLQNTNGPVHTWSVRPTTSPILAGIYNLGDYVDTMLVNQANCLESSVIDPSKKYIYVYGTCSFSTEVNEAISEIKSKNYSIQINDTPQ